MSTQDTTLPPRPEPSKPEELRSRFQFWYGNDLLAAPVHQSREERQWAAFQAGSEASAAIAAQAQQPETAEDSSVHQQAQQAQGVPAPTVLSVPENCKNRLFDPTVGDACVFDAGGGWPYQVEDAKKKLTLEAEYKVTKVEVHSSHTRIWIEGHDDWFNNMLFRVLAAAPQAEPKPQPEPLTDEQMWALWNSQGSDEMNQKEAVAFARAIEAAHGIGTKGGDTK